MSNAELVHSLKNTGVAEIQLPSDLTDRLLSLARRFYALPIADRMNLAAFETSSVLGYYPSEQEASQISGVTIPLFEKSRSRGYSSFDFIANDQILAQSDLFRANRWPSDSVLRAEACDLYELLRRFMGDLSRNLAHELSSLGRFGGLPTTCFDTDCASLMRLLRYGEPAIASTSKPHTDYEFLSLVTSDAAGLEVYTDSGGWQVAPFSAKRAVLLAGDMLEAATGGWIRSAMHRVHYGTAERHSVIFFQGLPLSQQLHYAITNTPCAPTFGQHLCSLLVRGAPHLSAQISYWEKVLDIPIPNKNPFQRLNAKALCK